jgi:2-oxoglutarate dehydrogenase E1 component
MNKLIQGYFLMYDIKTFYGPNAGYVIDLYERYLQNPASVDAATRAIFDAWSPESQLSSQQATSLQAVPFDVHDVVAAAALAHSIRERGHLAAHLDPLGSEPAGDPALLPETHGINDDILAQLPADIIGGHAAEGAHNALEAINALRAMYSGTISYEFDQVKSSDERLWLRDAVGLQLYHERPEPDHSRALLKRLTQVEVFERYLHQTYPGQKRFSIEGTDVLVPMLDKIIDGAVEGGAREVIIGMAHRGRLNVLAHLLEKPYTSILSEFLHQKHEEGVSLTDTFGFGWAGDVKYHLGAEHILGEGATVDLKITLSPNPSHLEYVNPVVEGMARASQEAFDSPGSPELSVDHTVPILIHGDAAFPGEGIVAETLNLEQLRGYWVGGTIHIIVNNQLGFTTEPEDSRSTHFASDLAKGYEIPIVHVNADDPEAALTAVRIAHAFRDQFHKDILIDLVGYRRWGHNEGDEPAFTQPSMYEKIRSHPAVRELYARRLEQDGIISPQEADAMLKDAFETLEKARQAAEGSMQQFEQEEMNGVKGHHGEVETPPQVPAGQLIAFNNALLSWPDGFSPNPKLARLLQRRAQRWGRKEASIGGKQKHWLLPLSLPMVRRFA